MREWAQDDGGVGEGEGKLSLEVSEAGAISGKATGPLGEQTATGEVDEQLFRIRLVPKDPGAAAFSGFVVAKRAGKTMKGRLQASSGDSLKVRDAAIELKKAVAPGKP